MKIEISALMTFSFQRVIRVKKGEIGAKIEDDASFYL